MASILLSTIGVDLNVPGKSVFFNDGLGELFVRATATDLDTVETALEAFTAAAPQVHIKARFLEVPKESLALLQPFPELTNGVTILSAVSFRKLFQTLESNPGTLTLAEPEVVTTSGRQTQMRATTLHTIITNFVFQEITTNATIVPQTEEVEDGPFIDLFPNVLPDGYTINLRTTASLKEFLGYENPTNSTNVYNSKGEKNDLPKALPKFRNQQASAHLNLWDGQTVVLGKFAGHFFVGAKEQFPEAAKIFEKTINDQINVQDKAVLVFITVTLVDPAGNRIHSDDELPFAKDGIPSQPK
jgi:Flp pilus assembly secretin CpaC